MAKPPPSGRPPVPRGVRAAAWRILQKLSYRAHDARTLLDRELADRPVPPRDRGLLTELVYGTVKRRATLSAVVGAYVSRPMTNVEPGVADLLRMAVYQIVMLQRVPRHAVVNETVELSRQLGLGHASRFVNGVLRSICRDCAPELSGEAGPGAIPVHGGQWRPMTRNVLPDIQRDTIQYLARAYSFPDWLVGRWLDRMGLEQTVAVCDYFNAPPPLWCRVNPAKATRDAVLAELDAAGLVAESGEHPDSFRVTSGGSPTDVPGFAQGRWLVQDLTAVKVTSLMGAEPGWRVLDVCAAPGGKTTHLAATVGPEGHVTACDRSVERLEQVAANCRRLGLGNVTCRALESQDGSDLPAGPFDGVLVDAPCSNTGVLGRRAEARWRADERAVQRLSRLQTQLAAAAADRLRPGGVLVYATCSIEPEENATVVEALLTRRPDLACLQRQPFVPGQPSDGGWAAKMGRREAKG